MLHKCVFVLMSPKGRKRSVLKDHSFRSAPIGSLRAAFSAGTDPKSTPMPTDTQAKWIWYYDSTSGSDFSTVYFRKTFVAPANPIFIRIGVDNSYDLYLNGALIGSGSKWYDANNWSLTTTPGASYAIAVQAVNMGGPGGVFADIRTVDKLCH